MQGKTYLCSIFCVVRCILYPGTKIVIASKTRGQALEVLEKISTILMPNSANLRLEIKDVKLNQANGYIEFKNASYIKVVTANDNARHNRANLLIVDEFRMVPKSIIDTVLRKFMTAPRTPGYLNKPEYKHLIERNKEIYLSSAWMKSHWSYEKMKGVVINMLDDKKKYFCCGLPYQISILEGLLSAEQIADEMSEVDFNEISFKMEMCTEWLGDSEGSLFSFDDMFRQRKIKAPFYPQEIAKKFGKKFGVPDKASDEVRIMTVDIALMSSKKNNNDATCIVLNSAIPTKNERYTANITYTENIEGMLTQDLALKIRRYYKYFDVDYIGLDAKGLGLGVYDCLVKEIYDPETGDTYEPLSCINNDELADRCADKTAPKVIYAIMGSANFNSEAALTLREGFRQGRINLLESEYECEDTLSRQFSEYTKMSPQDKLMLKLPYINTGLLINELINLQSETKNNVVRVYEKTGCRKDRYSSISYNYWITKQLERKLAKPKAGNDGFQIRFRAPKIK